MKLIACKTTKAKGVFKESCFCHPATAIWNLSAAARNLLEQGELPNKTCQKWNIGDQQHCSFRHMAT